MHSGLIQRHFSTITFDSSSSDQCHFSVGTHVDDMIVIVITIIIVVIIIIIITNQSINVYYANGSTIKSKNKTQKLLHTLKAKLNEQLQYLHKAKRLSLSLLLFFHFCLLYNEAQKQIST